MPKFLTFLSQIIFTRFVPCCILLYKILNTLAYYAIACVQIHYANCLRTTLLRNCLRTNLYYAMSMLLDSFNPRENASRNNYALPNVLSFLFDPNMSQFVLCVLFDPRTSQFVCVYFNKNESLNVLYTMLQVATCT